MRCSESEEQGYLSPCLNNATDSFCTELWACGMGTTITRMHELLMQPTAVPSFPCWAECNGAECLYDTLDRSRTNFHSTRKAYSHSSHHTFTWNYAHYGAQSVLQKCTCSGMRSRRIFVHIFAHFKACSAQLSGAAHARLCGPKHTQCVLICWTRNATAFS